MDKSTLYREAFKRAGLRLTDQRETICAWLAKTDLHPTPYQVYEQISLTHPEISRATVYNTLNTLQQLGAIVELSFGADHTHYDTDPTPHFNLICLRCHAINDFDGALPLDALRDQIGRDTDFQPLALRFDVLGLCAACRFAAANGTPAPQPAFSTVNSSAAAATRQPAHPSSPQ